MQVPKVCRILPSELRATLVNLCATLRYNPPAENKVAPYRGGTLTLDAKLVHPRLRCQNLCPACTHRVINLYHREIKLTGELNVGWRATLDRSVQLSARIKILPLSQDTVSASARRL